MQYQVKDTSGIVHTITAASVRINEAGGRPVELRLLNEQTQVIASFYQWIWFKPVEAPT